jgi:hypothetical protein
MLIIFEDQLNLLQGRYITLELDTIKFGSTGKKKTAFCVVENIDIHDMHRVEELKNKHQSMIRHYHAQSWNDCLDSINSLSGEWNGELDSFYQDIATRVQSLQDQPPDAAWDPAVIKQI